MPNYAAPKVTKIEFLNGMKIKIFFEGKTKVVDIGDSDLPERFPKLKQKDFFKTAVLDGGSIAWDNLHVDLDELIYECPEAKEEEEKDKEEFPATGNFHQKVKAALTKIVNR